MQNIIAFLIGLGITMVLSPFLYLLSKRLKTGQPVLHYVKEHSLKEGTPTFGGFIFLIGLLITALIMLSLNSTLAIVTLGTTFSFALLGFLDDYIQIKFKQNQGLKAYQKLLGQIGISIILSVFVFYFVGTNIFIPFVMISVDIGYFVIPLTIFVFLALVNSVNLIDGLDGLSSSVSIIYLIGLVAFMLIFQNNLFNNFNVGEINNLILICFIMIGCLVAWLCFNIYPAKIFMGDTGSLGLGGFLTCVTVFSKLTLLIPIIGVMFVVTSVSDILQVSYYKLKKKRIFKMAPFHHHLQMSGIHENKIVFYYSLITLIICLVNILITSVFV